MRRTCYLILLFVFTINLCMAQGFGYEGKTYLGNGFYKVKSGNHYGIIDKNDNVIISVEYQDISFRDGKALLIKDDILHGIVDSMGNVKSIENRYRVHPKYRYIYDGYIIVGKPHWGFITENGEPLRLQSKIKGAYFSKKKFPTMFDEVSPFVNGYAAVYTRKSGWKHIDKEGKERFILGNTKTKAFFRSSVYEDECIIITDEGIKQYQENASLQAVVKRVLSSTFTDPNYMQGSSSSKLLCKEGTLSLDHLMRVSKYETGSDSIVFIKPPRKISIKKVETPKVRLSIKEDMSVDLIYKNLQANEKGKAYTEVKLVNKSNEKFEELSVTLKCGNATREWSGSLGSNSEVRIAFNIPARFSTATLRQNVQVVVKQNEENIEFEFPITIKRYTPIRSR